MLDKIDTMHIDLGRKICKHRNLMNMSQMTLADHLGISYQQVQKYEKGISKVNLPRLVQICKALEVNPLEFLESILGPKVDGGDKVAALCLKTLKDASKTIEHGLRRLKKIKGGD